jgi:hypothetical protein
LDEINRADIDKAFGPLFSALTGDEITLSFKSSAGKNIVIKPQTAEEILPTEHLYVIPNDWRLIATMNTFDKTSLYEMSYAFMRRFAFIPVTIPDDISPELVKNYLGCWGFKAEDSVFAADIAKLWSLINEVRKIGPAIVEDLCGYLQDGGDYGSALINFVLPQFEGARQLELDFFVEKLEDLTDEIEELTEADCDNVEEFKDDYFQLGGQTIGS